MSAPFKYYFDFLSQPSRALYIFFKSAGIPFEAVPVALRKGEHLSDEFEQNINRFKKVPCIVDNGFKLAESIAIVKYVDGKNQYKYADHWYPKNFLKRIRVDEFLEWQHITIRANCSVFFQLTWLFPIMGKTIDPKQVEASKERMGVALDVVENIWLGSSNKFLTGDDISVADIFACCELEQPRMGLYDPCEGRPNMKAWMDRVKNETNPYYDDAHSIVNKIVAHKAKEAQKSKL